MPVCRACNEYRGNCSAIEAVTGAISACIASRGRGLIAPASGTRIYRCFLMLHDNARREIRERVLLFCRSGRYVKIVTLSYPRSRSVLSSFVSDGEYFISEAEFKLTEIILKR